MIKDLLVLLEDLTGLNEFSIILIISIIIILLYFRKKKRGGDKWLN